ncbi:MAG: 2-oxo acid dehydrogenase subunit E2 [Bacilli bacterium]|nr:2-oxo acid dehydrogenase subunit E2 [Bacilli bacterium]
MKNKRRFGDRKDAKKVRNLDGMHNIMVDLKPNRCDSDVYINQKIDVTNLIKYMEKLKKNNPDKHITYFHAFVTAIGKLFYNRPYLNRFITNRTYYEHNDVKIAFVAKTEFKDNAQELLCVLPIKENDNLMTISDLISKKVNKIRTNTKSDTNNLIDIVGKLPKLIRIFVVGIVKILDRHGWLPASMVNDNIYYSSAIVSNLGSIKCGSIYHNITNFGTSSMLATMGPIHKEKVIDEKGKEVIRDVCEFGINCDERIADGLYFAKSIQLLQYILENPELLETKASEKIYENKETK